VLLADTKQPVQWGTTAERGGGNPMLLPLLASLLLHAALGAGYLAFSQTWPRSNPGLLASLARTQPVLVAERRFTGSPGVPRSPQQVATLKVFAHPEPGPAQPQSKRPPETIELVAPPAPANFKSPPPEPLPAPKPLPEPLPIPEPVASQPLSEAIAARPLAAEPEPAPILPLPVPAQSDVPGTATDEPKAGAGGPAASMDTTVEPSQGRPPSASNGEDRGGAGGQEAPVEGFLTSGASLLRPPDLSRYYPWAARVKAVTGVTRLQLRVDASGRVAESKILESSPSGTFDGAALRLARTLRFQPARENGRPVASDTTILLEWKLNP